MTISYALESSLRGETFVELARGLYPRTRVAPSFENNTVFLKFLEVVLPLNGECFIPVLGLTDTILYVQRWFDEEVHPRQSTKLSYPLYVGGNEMRKTADAIIQSINRCPFNLRLSKIRTSKGLDYYGGQGLIFDEHWTPLMLCGFIMDIDSINKHITVVRPVCHVSPVVFERNDILSKAIVKKVIPYISAQGISVPSIFTSLNSLTYNSHKFCNVPVVIEPFDNYFTTPACPTTIDGLNDSIWDFLAANVSDLVS